MADKLTRKGARTKYADSSNAIASKNKSVIKAIVFGSDTPIKKQESAAMEDDSFRILMKEGQVIEPPLNLMTLSMMNESSTELGQIIDAMEINIEGFGGRLVLREMDEEEAKKQSSPIKSEKRKMKMFLLNFSADDEDMTSLRRKTRRDLELTGNAYWELIPKKSDPSSIIVINQIESHTIRISKVDRTPTKFTKTVVDPETGEKFTQIFTKRFRRFVQIRNQKKVYFKEWRDPRFIDRATGKAFATAEAAKKADVKQFAHPLKHFKIWSSRSPYGLPRYIGNLFSILGSRASEEINYNTFLNNNVPSMAILVSGNAMLTDGTIKRINEFTQSIMKRSNNYSKFLLLEAEPATEGIQNSGQAKISIERLKNEQHTDQLFQEYDKNNTDKLRRAYRLPPIFVGKSSDYNRGTAETSRKLAEEQIFAPERKDMDRQINMLLESKGFVFWSYRAFSPNITDNQDLIKLLATIEKTGGLTPNIARLVMGDVMNSEISEIKPENAGYDPDIPFSLTMARELNQIPTGTADSGVLAPQRGQMKPGQIPRGDDRETDPGDDPNTPEVEKHFNFPTDENGDLDTTQLVDAFRQLNQMLNKNTNWRKGEK